MSVPCCLKLVLDTGDMRKVTDVPSDLATLRSILTALFGSSAYEVKYRNAGDELVSVETDADLRTAYASVKADSALKLMLTPREQFQQYEPERERPEAAGAVSLFVSLAHKLKAAYQKGKDGLRNINYKKQFERQLVLMEISSALGAPMPAEHLGVTCTHCKQGPILGTRYKCMTCPAFDLCDICEATIAHAHNLLKLRIPEEKAPSVMASRPAMTAKDKAYRDIMPRLPGEQVLVTWTVRNSGKDKWPANTRLSHTRGIVYAPVAAVPTANPNEEVTIETFVTAPQQAGTHIGFFTLKDDKGTRFGDELQVEVSVSPDTSALESHLETLESMGFSDRERLVAVLTACNFDLSQALDQLSS